MTTMSLDKIEEFRENLRKFERELNIQNTSSCCCGVTVAQCHTLLDLQKKDNISLNQLTENLSLDKSTTSRTVESLVKRGLVRREIPEKNRRTTIISLTKQGIDVCNQINNGNNEYYNEVLSSIQTQELEIFLKSFKTIVKKMYEINREEISCQK